MSPEQPSGTARPAISKPAGRTGADAQSRVRELERRVGELEALYRNAPVGLCVLDRDLRFVRINERLAEINGIPAAAHLGRRVRDVLPELAAAVEPGMRRVLATREPQLNIEIASETPACPGVRRSWLEQWLPITDPQGEVTGLSIAVEEVTARKRAEESLETSRARLELLATVAERLLRAEDPQVIVEELCGLVMAHLGCEFFFNYLVEVPGERLRLNACAGVPAETVAAIRELAFGSAICGCAARDGTRVVATDIQCGDDPRAELVRSFGVQAYCCHPLHVGSQLIGTLSFGTCRRPAFTDDEVALMRSVADQVAVAMQRLQAAQSLRESEERLGGIVNSAMDAIVSVDDQQRIRLFNPAAEEMFGITAGEALGKPLQMLIPERFRDSHHQHVRSFAATGATTRKVAALGELSGLRASGEEFPVEASISHCTVAGEQLFTVILRDITERKRILRELRELNETLENRVAGQTREVRLLAEAISHLAEGVMITDDLVDARHRRIVFVNEAMCRITGYPAGELIGRTPAMLQGTGTDPDLISRIATALDAGRSCEFELVNYRRDGTAYPAEVFITPLVDAHGRRVNSVTIHRDITERKLAEDARADVGRLVEESLNEIYIFDAESLGFMLVNRGARANLGYSMDELRRLTPLELEPQFSRQRFALLLEPLRSGAANKVAIETKHRRKDGSFYDVEGNIQMTTFRGRPCFVAFFLDTSRRHELEHEVIYAAEEERQRISQDLHDDLGSLLTGIKLRIESIDAVLAEAGVRQAATSSVVVRLVQDAIGKTREIARGLHPVGAQAEDLMSALRGLARRVGSGGTVQCRFTCPVPVLVDDVIAANHLFRIAQEAVNNAVKYSGGSRIGIALRQRAGTIELSVSDNGSGIDAGTCSRGGLGFHIMNYRAEAINGSLRIEPGPGRGTKVTCTTPAKRRRGG